MLTASDLDVATLAARLTDSAWRGELFETMRGERHPHRPLSQAFLHAVSRMDASPEQLRELVGVFTTEQHNDALAELLFHQGIPEDLLLQFCERGEFIATLGHRHGPRRLLARLAALHAYPEAIISLGIDLFRDPTVPAEELAAFAHDYGRHEWMLRSLAELDASEPAKEAIYEALLTDFPDAAAYHARHLARSPRFTPEHLAAFLDRQDDPWVLVLLLTSAIEDPAKHAVVSERAAARSDQPEIALAIAQRAIRTRAAAPDLSDATARELLAAGEPEVLVLLADNPNTPEDVLEVLAQSKAASHARHIRNLARTNLKRR